MSSSHQHLRYNRCGIQFQFGLTSNQQVFDQDVWSNSRVSRYSEKAQTTLIGYDWLRLEEKFQCFRLWGCVICKSDDFETNVMLLTFKCLMTKDNEHRHVYTPWCLNTFKMTTNNKHCDLQNLFCERPKIISKLI